MVAINGILGGFDHLPGSACAQKLLQTILDCPPIPSTADPGDSTSYMAQIAMHELWRQATLILLHTVGLRKGCLAREVQKCIAQVRFIASSTRLHSPPAFWSAAGACPWFIIATVAITDQDRTMCRRALQDAGDSETYRSNKTFVEELWKRVDEEGHSVDWRAMIRDRGYTLGFL